MNPGRILIGHKACFLDAKSNIKSYKLIDLNYNYKDLDGKFLKNNKNQILENVWQSSKVYRTSFSCIHKKHGTILWNHPIENHLNDNNKLTYEYFAWKQKLMNNKFPIEYPVGISNKNKFEFIMDDNGKIYKGSQGYMEAYKNIYINGYIENVNGISRFNDLKKEYLNGQNILILCENLPYYSQYFNSENIFYSSGFCLGMSLYNSMFDVKKKTNLF